MEFSFQFLVFLSVVCKECGFCMVNDMIFLSCKKEMKYIYLIPIFFNVSGGTHFEFVVRVICVIIETKT